MALKLEQSGVQPLGQFDGKDDEVTSFKGGEVCTLTGVTAKHSGGTDMAAADVDGYTTANTRPAVTKTLTDGVRPLFLADDGTANYGTLFGQVVGGSVGQSTGGAALGPHTASGSGKVTLWDKPGTYSVTLDAADATAVTGLNLTNPTLAVGDELYATTAGLLTPNGSASFEAGLVVGRFIEFATNGSLVTTPLSLVSALNTAAYTQALFHWNPEL